MEFLFIWLVFAGLCAYVANAKGRSVGGWLIFGLVFGIFALLVIACLSNRRRAAGKAEGA